MRQRRRVRTGCDRRSVTELNEGGGHFLQVAVVVHHGEGTLLEGVKLDLRK